MPSAENKAVFAFRLRHTECAYYFAATLLALLGGSTTARTTAQKKPGFSKKAGLLYTHYSKLGSAHSMFDLLAIRDQLNQLEFKQGQRQVCVGRLSKAMPSEPAEFEEQLISATPGSAEHKDAQSFLDALGRELGRHDLSLSRGREDPDELYVTQQLRPPRELDMGWIREGINWVSKITTVVLEMILPGVIGVWLDRRFETQFLALLGFAVGVPLGIGNLIRMAKKARG